MDIGKVIEVGDRPVEVPAMPTRRSEPGPASPAAPERRERVKEPEKEDA